MATEPMTRLIDALSARTRFGELMEQAGEKNLRFLVSRRGKPKVVILSVEDYMRNIIKQPEILTKVQIGAKEAGLDTMTSQEIEAEVAAVRRKAQLFLFVQNCDNDDGWLPFPSDQTL